MEDVFEGDFVAVSLGGGISTTNRRREPAPWNSRSRNYAPSVDWYFPLLRTPKRVKTRIDTQCYFCERKIHKGEYRYRYSEGFSKTGNYKKTWFQLHDSCYFLLVELSIEKLRSTLPSYNRMGGTRKEKRLRKRNTSERKNGRKNESMGTIVI